MRTNKKVVVGMSGGVDSSVTAYLLKEQGFDVIGVTMMVWSKTEEGDTGSCCGLSAVEDARRVAALLDIPYYVLNFKEVFKQRVVDYFIDEYKNGRTPNPCIACNRYVKWEALLERALLLGADYIATGHYANIVRIPESGRYTLETARSKDQSYALYGLSQHQLAHTLMPLGSYTKEEVRGLASKIGLPVADKPDSQEICFIPGNNYGKFINENTQTEPSPGWFVDVDGNRLGMHKGITNYTIGQRKGLGITFGKPMFVKKIDPAANEIILSDNNDLFEYGLTVANVNFMSVEAIDYPMEVSAKIRYSQQPADCIIEMQGERLLCRFVQPQRAVTPGQAAVFYDNGLIVCGGTIC